MAKSPPLDRLRERLDKIDRDLHALLVERAQISLEVGLAKRAELGAGKSPLRPTREAELLRQLLALPSDPMPKPTLFRIWREIIGASAWLQAPFSLAAAAPSDPTEVQLAASALYGAMIPTIACDTPHQVLRALASGKAQVGVLPDPAADPWWSDLLEAGFTDLKIVGRLPFLENGETPRGRYFVVGALDFQSTGSDQSYLGLVCTREVSLGGLSQHLQKSGLAGRRIAVASPAGGGFAYLAEIDEYVSPDDARLTALAGAIGRACSQILVLGACPDPIRLAQAKGS